METNGGWGQLGTVWHLNASLWLPADWRCGATCSCQIMRPIFILPTFIYSSYWLQKATLIFVCFVCLFTSTCQLLFWHGLVLSGMGAFPPCPGLIIYPASSTDRGSIFQMGNKWKTRLKSNTSAVFSLPFVSMRPIVFFLPFPLPLSVQPQGRRRLFPSLALVAELRTLKGKRGKAFIASRWNSNMVPLLNNTVHHPPSGDNISKLNLHILISLCGISVAEYYHYYEINLMGASCTSSAELYAKWQTCLQFYSSWYPVLVFPAQHINVNWQVCLLEHEMGKSFLITP